MTNDANASVGGIAWSQSRTRMKSRTFALSIDYGKVISTFYIGCELLSVPYATEFIDLSSSVTERTYTVEPLEVSVDVVEDGDVTE